eukprot:684332_1
MITSIKNKSQTFFIRHAPLLLFSNIVTLSSTHFSILCYFIMGAFFSLFNLFSDQSSDDVYLKTMDEYSAKPSSIAFCFKGSHQIIIEQYEWLSNKLFISQFMLQQYGSLQCFKQMMDSALLSGIEEYNRFLLRLYYNVVDEQFCTTITQMDMVDNNNDDNEYCEGCNCVETIFVCSLPYDNGFCVNEITNTQYDDKHLSVYRDTLIYWNLVDAIFKYKLNQIKHEETIHISVIQNICDQYHAKRRQNASKIAAEVRSRAISL